MIRTRPNWLLAALDRTSFANVSALCEPVTTRLDQILWKPDEEIDYVYFPIGGCLSVLSVLENRREVEVGTVGWEGMAGLSLLHGVATVSTKCIVQIEGAAQRIRRDAFVDALAQNADLVALMHRYAQFWSEQSARSIGCNGVHSINRRCARWLLMTEDRVGAATISLSHKFLAIMLGVRRASVSVAAKALQDAGLITYSRGKINIVDRPGLIAASCGCYKAVVASYSTLLPRAEAAGRQN